ncbi:hypothetical protein KST17_01765 [Fusobacterium canifelinum]|jgi:hypothetical protein|uniref:Lipoprotein n=1 Tax=Fusobacterium nucleatum subsp. polymorphum TaxID=76857 RepID=A0A2C6AWK0_FUSNP|nr:hypothetical protein [Fusobacterium polymorphum]PHH96696.1 hypothetical protein CA840_04795 [Fusobacterium polymorphum]
MKKSLFLLVVGFSLVGCSDLMKWNPNGILREEYITRKKSSDIDNMTDSKYNLEEKVEKNF